ncbi:MAG: tetratricopeptide repeat protein [Deltaproteobacteria bacterium]|nr:tetratricopeptide repeat protein [Deltaproteobacteria bacterium]
MGAGLDRALLDAVSGFVAERLGLHFPEERWPDLARGLANACRELGFEEPDACARRLATCELTVRQLETLASHLTVGETCFFRDPASFEALERQILLPLVARRAEAGRTLRLWSAGCCTGEEAYSLAITCLRVLPDLRSWNVSILATDINPKFLAKAEAGVYSEWSFRGAPAWLRERFFSPAGGKTVSIDSAVRSLVRFGYLNLAEDAYPSLHNGTNGMDVVFCRNVLMYFTPEHQRRVAASLHRCLVDGGCLLVNPAEAGTSLFPMFVAEHVGDVCFYRRTSEAGRVAARLVSVPLPPGAGGLPGAMAAGMVELPVAVDPLASAAPMVASVPVPAVEEPGAPEAVAGESAASPLVLARALADQGRLEEALAACTGALAADRTDPTAHFLHATICHELGRLEEAVVALGRVLYLDQDFVLAHHGLGGLYRRLGKRKQAQRHLAVALELLAARDRDAVVPESDGMTCGRLLESVRVLAGV